MLDADRPMLTNEYQRVARPAPGSPFAMVEASLAVPFAWDEESRGVLSVGFTHRRRVDRSDLQVLETFAELAAVACRNATRHAGLAILARTDALTGCLNHAALHEGLHREIERMERGAAPALTLVLFDLDDFKQVNEEHGHLVGDELLRRVGAALQGATRPYDLAARYGGDEFALVAVEADEEEACAIAERTLARLAAAIGEFSATGTGATAGVAEWTPGVTATELVARADRALLHGKQEGIRGLPHPFSSLPESVARGRFGRRSERGLPAPPPLPAPSSSWPVVPAAAGDERLRKRTRQLALASALGARLTAMNDSQAIAEAAVEELHRAFGYYLCAVVRAHAGRVEAVAVRGDAFVRLDGAAWSQPAGAGLIGRCLRTRRAVAQQRRPVRARLPRHGRDAATCARSSRCRCGSTASCGAPSTSRRSRVEAFDEDDVRLVQTVADQVGSALRSAALFERLRRAYEGAAEALAAALERPRSAAALAEAAGRRLALPEPELRDLRIAAVAHDLRHAEEALAGDPRRARLAAEILSSAEVLAGVRGLLGGACERWDGTGGPDGLAGEAIPLGARVIAACDLLQDLLDAGLGEEAALAALRADRGADPGVVAALAAVLAETVAPGPLGR